MSAKHVQVSATASPPGGEPVLASGTYTPTLGGVSSNVASSSAFVCQWMRVGDVVSVSGMVGVDPTLAATTTRLGISLPVASNFTAAQQCAGTLSGGAGAASGAIYGEPTLNIAELDVSPVTAANAFYFFTFTYQIL